MHTQQHWHTTVPASHLQAMHQRSPSPRGACGMVIFLKPLAMLVMRASEACCATSTPGKASGRNRRASQSHSTTTCADINKVRRC